MVKKIKDMIFLSASIPLEQRDPKYFETADIVAIRDAVRALASVVLPNTNLVWGGHPSITPLIRYIVTKMKSNVKDHITIYQSEYYKDVFPSDNFDFEKVITIPRNIDLESSLLDMRIEMIEKNNFNVGVFIGGMEGVEDEYEIFIKTHPKALILPVASTGAAAKFIFENSKNKLSIELLNNYAYMSLFRHLLKDYIKL